MFLFHLFCSTTIALSCDGIGEWGDCAREPLGSGLRRQLLYSSTLFLSGMFTYLWFAEVLFWFFNLIAVAQVVVKMCESLIASFVGIWVVFVVIFMLLMNEPRNLLKLINCLFSYLYILWCKFEVGILFERSLYVVVVDGRCLYYYFIFVGLCNEHGNHHGVNWPIPISCLFTSQGFLHIPTLDKTEIWILCISACVHFLISCAYSFILVVFWQRMFVGCSIMLLVPGFLTHHSCADLSFLNSVNEIESQEKVLCVSWVHFIMLGI